MRSKYAANRCSAAAFMSSGMSLLDHADDRGATFPPPAPLSDRNDRTSCRHSSVNTCDGLGIAVPLDHRRRMRRALVVAIFVAATACGRGGGGDVLGNLKEPKEIVADDSGVYVAD